MDKKWMWLIGVIVVVVGVLLFSSSGVMFSPRGNLANNVGVIQKPSNGTNVIYGNVTRGGNGSVIKRLSDLKIDFLNVSVKLIEGNNSGNGTMNDSYYLVILSAYVMNVGNANAPISRTKFAVDGVYGQRYIYTPALRRGQGVFVNDFDKFDSGNYVFNATADGLFKIRESNENNNNKVISFQV